jgi:hypothetical protein
MGMFNSIYADLFCSVKKEINKNTEIQIKWQKDVKYPACLAGERQCPPEDCGGPRGYADFLKAINDPKHPEHERMLEWSGGDFNPELFHVDIANHQLKYFLRKTEKGFYET